MLKKTITFEDLDGNLITEDFFFHLSKAELVEMEVSEAKGLSETLKEIVDSKDGALIIDRFKKLILACYGKKSEDGRRFIKSKELTNEFSQTDAYSVLFVELASDAAAAAAFIRGVVPASLEKELNSKELNGSKEIIQRPSAPQYPSLAEFASPAQKDLTKMSKEELIEAMKNAGK